MPTRKGWALALSALATGAAGRVLGVPDLYVVAAAGVALVAAATAYVRLRRPVLEAARRLAPARVRAGGTARVVLTVRNRGRAAPPLVLDDGHARFRRPPVPAGTGADLEYRLDAPRRGLVAVGPLQATVEDPFGLAARTVPVLAPGTLVVHPVVESVALPPVGSAASAASGPAATPVPGGEFHGLRPYEVGDDVRLVHWPTSARLDALVVRQDERPRLRRTVVVLDVRRSVHQGASFETALSAAASLVAAACAGDGTARLVTTAGLDSGTAGGEAHLEEVLDLLAAVQPDLPSGLDAVASLLAGEDDATLVLVTTSAGSAAGPLAAAAGDAAESVALVLAVGPGTAAAPAPAFDRVVTVPEGRPWAAAWAGAVHDAVGRR